MPPLLSSSAGPMHQRRGSGCSAWIRCNSAAALGRGTPPHPTPSPPQLPPIRLYRPLHLLHAAAVALRLPVRGFHWLCRVPLHSQDQFSLSQPSRGWHLLSIKPANPAQEENWRSIKRKDLVPLTRWVSRSYIFDGLTCKEEKRNPSLQGTLIMCLTMTRGPLCQ